MEGEKVIRKILVSAAALAIGLIGAQGSAEAQEKNLRCVELLTSRHMPKITCLPDKIPFSIGEGETILETALRADVPLGEDTGELGLRG